MCAGEQKQVISAVPVLSSFQVRSCWDGNAALQGCSYWESAGALERCLSSKWLF